jgi:bifunctional pyridoxal-dependent enzyme with beta-cystathionase and maltose regulon repressor activities
MYNRNSKKERNSALINENKNFNVDRNRVADEILKESENKPSVTTNPINPMEDLYLKGLNFRK